MKIIAYMHSDFKEKFGIPRQSGLADEVMGKIVFEPEYSKDEAFRGLEEYSHLWVLWKFSLAEREDWSPTVRPPRLGGNRRMGVFATRSPFRPNPIGLSSVRLHGVCRERGRIVLTVSGIDMLDGTPIYDVKPYLSYTDSHPEAKCGFADKVFDYALTVKFSEECGIDISDEDRVRLTQILSEDPRPSYIDDPKRIYTFTYGRYEVSFTVSGDALTVTKIEKSLN